MLPFSWAIYLLIGHYEPLNFLLCKSPLSSPLKKLAVSSAKYQCLVLLASIFGQKYLLSLFHGLFTWCSGIMNPWNFWSWKVLPAFYQKKLFSSSLLHQCMVLLLSTFCQKFSDFDEANFWHIRVLLKQKQQLGKNREWYKSDAFQRG